MTAPGSHFVPLSHKHSRATQGARERERETGRFGSIGPYRDQKGTTLVYVYIIHYIQDIRDMGGSARAENVI